MINSIPKDFKDFINQISLNSKEENDIKNKHNGLTNMIKEDSPKGYKIIKTRLSGSYSKHTVLNEFEENKIPDVDVIVIIEKNNNSVEQICLDFFNYFKEKKGKVTSNIRQQSNSIGIIYSNISVDIVIGIIEQNELKICSHKRNCWITSNSLKHVEYMTIKNEKYEGFSYYDLMKLFKYINKEILNNKLKSYTLEQLVHQCSPQPRAGLRLHQAFAETLNNMTKISTIDEIRDCCDINKKGYDDKDILVYRYFREEIQYYSELAKKAITGDRKKWQDIFGDRFPKQPEIIVKNEREYDESQTPWCN